MKTHKLVFF